MKAIDYIEEQSSESGAKKIAFEIAKLLDKISKNPERNPPDKFKKNNDGNYRVFEKHRYRVSYHIGEKEIRVVRFRHTKMEAKEY